LQLLSKLQPGQQVIDQLEWGDDLIARAAPGTFRNPPGLLISFVEMNLTPPSYFESTRSRKLREAVQAEAAADQLRRLQLQSAYEEYRKERIEQYIDEELDPEEYKRLFTAHKKELALKYKSLHLNPTSLTELAHGGVRTEIVDRIAVLTFDQFLQEQNII
jgi:S-adenosylmethionine:tRNA-ribosyltransferase-isomerase (queuine synthetase)